MPFFWNIIGLLNEKEVPLIQKLLNKRRFSEIYTVNAPYASKYTDEKLDTSWAISVEAFGQIVGKTEICVFLLGSTLL